MQQLISFWRESAITLSVSSRLFWVFVAAVAGLLSPLDHPRAHEVWIEPYAAHLSKGAKLEADLRIGDMFAGDHLIYIPQQTERLLVLTADGSFDLNPRVGSRPVISVPPEQLANIAGDVVVVYQSANSYVHYQSQEKFFRFAEKKGAPHMRQAHTERQLPDSGFVERYKRFAKASISVGSDRRMVNDRAVGMELEFVSLGMTPLSDGPYEAEFQLLYQGRALPEARATLFSRDPDGLVSTSRVMSDRRGRIRVRAEAGHRYLLDHVTLREADPGQDRNRPVWESLWASMTFSGPDS